MIGEDTKIMNSFYFKKKKVCEILDGIKNGLIEGRRTIEKALSLDYKQWEYKIEIEELINHIDIIKQKEYLPKFSKEKVVDGIGKIVLICNQNPYIIFNFVLSCLYTNNKVEIVLENKMIATNKVLLETIKKALKKFEVEDDTITYLELNNSEDIISKQDNYDLIYYCGNKSSYLNLKKRIHIDSKFEEFSEIDLYTDSKDYKEQIIEIEKWAYINEIKINFYKSDLDEVISEMNKYNNINKITIVFSKDVNKIAEFVKRVKSEKIYVNRSPISEYVIEFNLENLIYTKNIIW